jgi:ppGpp synthetase/RelA/SpoT-type nucleotidyltranferase
MPKYYPAPEYSRREVNRAGQVLVNPNASDAEMEVALSVINNWRASHNFPLNTFQMRLRKVARKINPESLVAQRIKRLSSIKLKLERFPDMNMSQIQDIGGCRAIMKDVMEVDALVNIYKHDSRGIKHKLAKEQDYILNPKTSGYRGVHLIYKYRSDKSTDYDDMRIEIQVRTLMQHAWATAVETVGTFIKQSLKSSQGEESWLRFFTLMGSAMAIAEGKPNVPGTTDDFNELRKEITFLSKTLDVEGHLTAYRDSIQVLGADRRLSNAHYYLLELDPAAGRVIIKSYTQTQLATASLDYMTLEKRITNDNRDAVLVSADSIEALKLAYPNYYLDTDIFLGELRNLTITGQLSLPF